MSEPVRFTRITEAYLNTADAYTRQRRSTTFPVDDTVDISAEAQQKSKEYQSNAGEESSSENSSAESQANTGIDILNLSRTATKEQIRNAYRSAIKQYHPDNFAGLSPEFRELAEEKSKQINLAYKRLTGM
jgi:DnaJ like chaperone protein